MKIVSAIFLAIILSFNADAKYQKIKWEMAGDEEEIKVYSAKDYGHSSGVVPIKVETIFNHSIGRILSVISNSERKIEWVPHMVTASNAKQISDYEKIEYARYRAPWPFDDRVFLVQSKGHLDKETKTVTISVKSVELPEFPHDKRFVRGNTYFGRVVLIYIDKNKTWMETQFLTDFKGNIPVWIINLVQKTWPRNLMKQLEKQLLKTDIEINPKYVIE
jgi:hypothetical protein